MANNERVVDAIYLAIIAMFVTTKFVSTARTLAMKPILVLRLVCALFVKKMAILVPTVDIPGSRQLSTVLTQMSLLQSMLTSALVMILAMFPVKHDLMILLDGLMSQISQMMILLTSKSSRGFASN